MEIGVDIIEIQRFGHIREDEKLQQKIFTKNEIQYCLTKRNCAQHFAVRFAGKEAIMKAFSPYGINLNLKQIEILNDNTGRPMVKILTEISFSYQIKISLSHSQDNAIAFAVVSKDN